MKKIFRQLTHCFAWSFLAIGATSSVDRANAQAWPTRPVTFIVSQAGGASPDVMARILADRLSRSLGQGVVIENKPGGANVIGATAAARAAPDGYTFFFATSAALATNPFLMEKMTYDPVKDFRPVTMIARSHQVLVSHPDVPAKNISELVALERKQPGKLSVAVDSPRNLAGVTAQALNKRAGLELSLVPYPNINAALQDTMTGRVELGVFSVSIAEALIRDGKFRPLGIASSRRSTSLPDVPTLSESFKDFDFSGWFMLMAPVGTPDDIVNKLSRDVAEAMSDEKIREMAPKLGFEIETGSPEAARKFLAEQLDLWKGITAELGMKPQ